eukprot:364728-Chlamydomonas_euryale.AAC.10
MDCVLDELWTMGCVSGQDPWLDFGLWTMDCGLGIPGLTLDCGRWTTDWLCSRDWKQWIVGCTPKCQANDIFMGCSACRYDGMPLVMQLMIISYDAAKIDVMVCSEYRFHGMQLMTILWGAAHAQSARPERTRTHPSAHERASAPLQGWMVAYRGTERACKITRLLPGTRYTFALDAANGVGPSPRSDHSVFATQATVPSQPDPPSVVSASADSVILRWCAPAGNGSPVTSYRLEVCEGGGDGGSSSYQLVYAGPKTNCIAGGLRSGARYLFRLLAENDVRVCARARTRGRRALSVLTRDAQSRTSSVPAAGGEGRVPGQARTGGGCWCRLEMCSCVLSLFQLLAGNDVRLGGKQHAVASARRASAGARGRRG